MNINEKLKNLYNNISKHSNYQILSDNLKNIIKPEELIIKSRYESERLEYILKYIKPQNQSIIDIGGNTGYFSFELLTKGAKEIIFFEGNKLHSEFVKQSAMLLNVKESFNINNRYFRFCDEKDIKRVNITLLLNVIHHIGDDFGNNNISISEAKNKMLECINCLAKMTDFLVLQLGFCWKGNRNLLLFENGTKKEMIDFIINGTINFWDILKIGVPEKINGVIKYQDLSDKNIVRVDELGEFLNRPLFIIKSKYV